MSFCKELLQVNEKQNISLILKKEKQAYVSCEAYEKE